ncbi:Flotillin-like protein 1 [Camellia lanceoleosa]|uniref:Flotillin-like protein 1 n=1 Tax=Camellia lanceoleosa TaxID=1840588 RepID=A0ACC0F9L4_9ERIC|nr:Flotillin-like protein 1 [Camellia lanceoleosa]
MRPSTLANSGGHELYSKKKKSRHRRRVRPKLLLEESCRVDPKSVSVKANNGGGEGGAGGGGMKDVAGVYSMLPPLFQTVHEQTGMLPPAWLGTLPSSS